MRMLIYLLCVCVCDGCMHVSHCTVEVREQDVGVSQCPLSTICVLETELRTLGLAASSYLLSYLTSLSSDS